MEREMAFIMPLWHCKFGLMNAPMVFHWFINEVLREALDHCAYMYLDDIFDLHLVRGRISRLRQANSPVVVGELLVCQT